MTTSTLLPAAQNPSNHQAHGGSTTWIIVVVVAAVVVLGYMAFRFLRARAT